LSAEMLQTFALVWRNIEAHPETAARYRTLFSVALQRTGFSPAVANAAAAGIPSHPCQPSSISSATRVITSIMDTQRNDSPVVAITGASQGLGAAIAVAFAERGKCRLALLARRKDELEKVAERCGKFPDAEAAAFSCDVSDPDSVQNAARQVAEHFGPAD